MGFGRPMVRVVVAVLAAALVTANLPTGAVALPTTATTHMLSVSDGSPPRAGDEDTRRPSISSDGRYVVFASAATNIGALGTSAHHNQVYLRDVAAGTTTVVSASGGTPGNGDSAHPVISANGMFVAFLSSATNLVASARSGVGQALVWSRADGSLTNASVSNEIPTPANGPVGGVAISDDGSVVAFSSIATNLSAASTFGKFQVYSRDMKTRVTALESIDTRKPMSGAESDAVNPVVSGDGTAVGFVSAATLTSIDSRAKQQVYVRDTASAITRLVSVNSSGASAGSADSSSPSLSADGRTVAFASRAVDLTAPGSHGASQVYVRNLVSGLTQLVSVDAADRDEANGLSDNPDITADGSVVAFESIATNLVPETSRFPIGSTSRAYVRNLVDDQTISACRLAATSEPCPGTSREPAMADDGLTVAFASDSSDIVPDIETHDWQVFSSDLRMLPRVDRISGADRFEVSAGTATDAFATGVPVAYVASGAAFPDALSGSAAAGAERGPVLLVTKSAIPTVVGIELHRLMPHRIVLLGGTASVDPSVEAALAAYAPVVTRISGADRYEVSAGVSKAVFGRAGAVGGEHPPVYIASGATFPDALSGSAAAGRAGGPVLLVTRDTIPAPVMAELKRLAPSKMVVLGGRNTIADSLVAALGQMAPTTRVDGPDRFAVSAAVSASAFAGGATTVYVASGAVFPDALSGSAAAVQNRAPVLLVTQDQVPAPVALELDRLNPTRIVVLGGPNTVSDAVLHALEGYLEPS